MSEKVSIQNFNVTIVSVVYYTLFTFYLHPEPIFSYLSILKNKPVSKINLQKTLFTIDKFLGKNALNNKEYNGTINRIISNVKMFVKNTERPKTSFIKISEYLAQYENFIPVGLENDWNVNLFTSFLKDKKGSCVPFSLLYLIISERLNLPLYGSLSPEHIFIKFSNEKESFNVETVYFEHNQLIYEPGTFISDKMYKSSFKIPERAIKEGFFLQKLNKKQVLGIYLNNLGALVLQDVLSESDYKKFKYRALFGRNLLIFALKFYHDNFSTFLNLANFYTIWLFDEDKARKFLRLSKKILINEKIKVTTAEFLIRTKNPLFKKYVKRIPLNLHTKLYLATKFYLTAGNFKKAKTLSLKILQNNPQNQEYLSYYVYSLIKSNQLDMAYVIIDNFKKAYRTPLSSLIYAVEGVLHIYKYKHASDNNDLINRIGAYMTSINWNNAINKYLFKEYYDFLKDNQKIADILHKYISIFHLR